MALIKCPECGREISDKAASCPNCGAVVKKKFCQHCGESIDNDCVVCPKCGKQVGEIGWIIDIVTLAIKPNPYYV